MSPVGRVTHRWGNDCGKIPGDRMVIFHRILHKGCNLRHFLSFFDSKSGVWAMRSKNASFLAQRFIFLIPLPVSVCLGLAWDTEAPQKWRF